MDVKQGEFGNKFQIQTQPKIAYTQNRAEISLVSLWLVWCTLKVNIRDNAMFSN